jgi:hypothetical protein
MRRLAFALVVGAAVVATGAASGKGPSGPGLAPSVTDQQHQIRYVPGWAGGSTTVYAERNGRVLATVKVAGAWGVPAVTSTGVAGGLSPDGRTLVLAEPPDYHATKGRSRFLILGTSPLVVRETVELDGAFTFDALSPGARTLYLIQHVSVEDALAYRVRGYDLRQHRLLRGAIVAKGEGETMSGYPMARATPSTGRWVYTLYRRESGKPFVHALNAAERWAVCIDVPWQGSAYWQGRLLLSSNGRRLTVRLNASAVATIDTRSFKVT